MQVTINGRTIRSEEGKTILDVALANGLYIPHLCYHPGIGGSRLTPPCEVVFRGAETITNDQETEYAGCSLCLVQVEGNQGLCHACTTVIDDGMVIYTDTPEIQEERREQLTNLLSRHPHVCLTCGLAEGCNRKLCPMGIQEEARCCWKFGKCVLQKVAAYMGFEEHVDYRQEDIHTIDDNPLFTASYNLCITCLLCVTACREVAGRDALGFVNHNGRLFVGAKAPTPKESGCRLCMACVEVCPTGALREKDPTKKKSRIRSEIRAWAVPPEREEWKRLTEENVGRVPQCEGVYTLFNEAKELIQISGTENLREALADELSKDKGAQYFEYEEDKMFTMRERQLIQRYMTEHGGMPPGNDEMDELF